MYLVVLLNSRTIDNRHKSLSHAYPLRSRGIQMKETYACVDLFDVFMKIRHV